MFAFAPLFLHPLLILTTAVIYLTVMSLFHELGHWLAGLLAGAECRVNWVRNGLTIALSTHASFPGGVKPAQDVLFTLGGPLVHMCANLPFLVQEGLPELRFLAQISLVLIATNLLPVLPCDGYYLVRTVRAAWGHSHLVQALVGLQWVLFAGIAGPGLWLAADTLAVPAVGIVGRVSMGALGLVVLFRLSAKLIRIAMTPGLAGN